MTVCIKMMFQLRIFEKTKMGVDEMGVDDVGVDETGSRRSRTRP